MVFPGLDSVGLLWPLCIHKINPCIKFASLSTLMIPHMHKHTHIPRKYEKVYFPHNEAFWGEQSGSQQDMKIERSKKIGSRFLCCLGNVSWVEGLCEYAEDRMILTFHLCQEGGA